MTASDLLASLTARGFTLAVTWRGTLRYCPTPDPGTLEALRRHKADLITLLGGIPPVPSNGASGNLSPTPPADHQDHADQATERAAIREYDGGQCRDAAEASAVVEVGPCYCCHGRRFWVSKWGPIRCGACSPPADPKLVVRWIELPGR